MLVLVRIAIGWHFLYSGIWKLENPDFSSDGFLSQAKGPLADKFLALVPDGDRRERLDPENKQRQLDALDNYFGKFQDLYQLDREQLARAEKIVKDRKAELDAYLTENEEPIRSYLHDLGRWQQAKDAPWRDIPSQQRQLSNERTRLRRQAQGWVEHLDLLWHQFKRDLDGALDNQQRAHGRRIEPLTRMEKIDLVVTYSNIAIGVCLLAGLFTRFACFSGGLFLLAIVLAQPDWPGLYPPPHPSAGRSLVVNKEFLEMLVMFALAATRVGRWGGLDFFVHHLFIRPVFGRRKAR